VLQVLSGARLETTNAVVGNGATSTGVVEVSGAGAAWDILGFMNLGVNGLSNIKILSGGRVVNTSSARMTTLGGESHVEVGGENSTWTVGTTITVGEAGYATLDIHSGGRVTSTSAVIAESVGSRGVVDVEGEGSTWEITGTLDVSDPGEAELRIADGGRVSTTGVARIAGQGRLILDDGRLEVDGAGGLTNQGLLEGSGRIQGAVTNSVPGDVRVRTGDRLVIGLTLVNASDLEVDGGELEVLGTVSNSGDVSVRNGVMRSAGYNNHPGSMLAAVGGPVAVHGPVTNSLGAQVVVGAGSTAVFHDTLTNNGELTILPDSSALMLKDLFFSGGATFSLQLSAASAGAAAPAQVDGGATLAGTLEVDLASGFTPAIGDAFELLTAAGGRSGVFGNEVLPSLPGGLGWDLAYTPDAVTLTVVPNLTADFDVDGDVDAADLARWKTGFGLASGALKASGDENGDGDVDGADFLAWQRQVGAGGATQAAAPVPEPGGVALAASALVGAVALRRRSRR
jgi:T5SS/PEP-CTERM-associated repeat protein